MFFCTKYYSKVTFALKIEDENSSKLQSLDKKLSDKIDGIEKLEAKL